MLDLITLFVLVTLSNIVVAKPLRLNNDSVRPAEGPSAGTLEHLPLQSSTTSVSAGNPSNTQEAASVAGDSPVGTSVVFRYPNGAPAATVFMTTVSTPKLSTAVLPTTTPQTTTQPAVPIKLTKTLSASSGQPPENQPAQSLLNATGAPCPDASCSVSTTSPSAALPNRPTTRLPTTSTSQIPSNARSSRPSPTGSKNHTTTVEVTSKVQITSTIPATATAPPSTSITQNNLEMARTLNIIFKTLTSDSTCSLNRSFEAVACINGQLAMCDSNGKYTLTQCPQGMQCFALPKTAPGNGVDISCDTVENAQLIMGLNGTSPKDAISSPTGPGTSPTTAGNSASSTSSTSPTFPGGPASLSTNSIPQFVTPTTSITITFLTGSLQAPNLPTQLPTGGVTTTVTQTIIVPPSSPVIRTRRTKSSHTEQPTDSATTVAGGVSSIGLPGGIAIITETVTSTATVTETVTATVKG
ncbi:hypothetical protein FGG08_002346 [Glutinoglossum americanum]|uniref:Carbohydrate-binding module family 19 domain-containing protein n=1 Tax=Glutinoglossum americanum TaxID=1670608 RepID=A0A9P8I9E2_9PEZI|nr:hypothetical protein FGG08_002346 [Glutinoglossum americanum]